MAGKREILEDEFNLLGVFLQHLLEERIEPRAIRSLILAEDGNGNLGMLRAFEGKSGDVDSVNQFQLKDFQRLSRPAAKEERVVTGGMDNSIEGFVNPDMLYHLVLFDGIDEDFSRGLG